MSAELDPLQHRRLWEQLAWVANGSAGDDERAAVEAHLPHCADCRAELALQRRLVEALAQEAAPPHAGEAGLSRLMSRIELAGTPQPQRAAATTRWLAAAVLVQAVALAAAGVALWQRSSDGYQTLSAPAPAAGAARVRLVPAPQMALGELQALLARQGLVIVEASADGRALGLAPRPGGAVDISALRAEPGVLLAEPVAP